MNCSLNNGLFRIKWTHSHLLFGVDWKVWTAIWCGLKSVDCYFVWTEKFRYGLCSHFSRLCGLKNSRNSSRLVNRMCEWTLALCQWWCKYTKSLESNGFRRPVIYCSMSQVLPYSLCSQRKTWPCSSNFPVRLPNKDLDLQFELPDPPTKRRKIISVYTLWFLPSAKVVTER